AGIDARWHAFDFMSGTREDGTYAMLTTETVRSAAPVIILDGAYASRPELADLIELTVLVDTPARVRHARSTRRDAPAFLRAWHERWDAAEEYYFSQVRPPSAFDIILRLPTSTGNDL